MFNQFGDVERCSLRPGNVHSAHEWRDVLEPLVARYRDRTVRRYPQHDRDLGLGLAFVRKGKPRGQVRTECAGGIPRSG